MKTIDALVKMPLWEQVLILSGLAIALMFIEAAREEKEYLRSDDWDNEE